MTHSQRWNQREYQVEPGEVFRMKSGTTLEVLKVFGSYAVVNFLTRGRSDYAKRGPKSSKVARCSDLEKLERVA